MPAEDNNFMGTNRNEASAERNRQKTCAVPQDLWRASATLAVPITFAHPQRLKTNHPRRVPMGGARKTR
jgi:hypothetical protein